MVQPENVPAREVPLMVTFAELRILDALRTQCPVPPRFVMETVLVLLLISSQVRSVSSTVFSSAPSLYVNFALNLSFSLSVSLIVEGTDGLVFWPLLLSIQ